MCINKKTITKNSDNVRIVTREEEAKIVSFLRNSELSKRRAYFSDVADLIEVLVDTGMRKLEAEELMYGDIDFTANVIRVRQSKSNPRRVPMTGRVAIILKRRQEENQDKPFSLNDIQLRKAWTWAKDELGITDPRRLVLHSLRTTCVRRLMDAGVDLEIICEWLGRHEVRNIHRKAPLPLKKLTEAAKMLEQYNLSHLQ